jgi:hypothetical protein
VAGWCDRLLCPRNTLDSVVDEVVGFSMGLCSVMRDGLKEYVDFADSPSGKRYYLIGLKGALRIPISEGA